MTSEDSDQYTEQMDREYQEILFKVKELRKQVFNLSDQCNVETIEESLLQSVDCLDEAINDLENRVEDNLNRKELKRVNREIIFENKKMLQEMNKI